ncbi:MAG: paraquat-inducible protein A, partial [Phycisphaerales bacterium]
MDDISQVNLEIKDKSKKDSRSASESKTPLAFHFDSSSVVWVVPLLLVVALTTNIIALKLPFLEIKMFPHDPEAYSIPHTVTLMWVKMKLYWVAILIAGFSLVFPFVKLLSLFSLWYLPMRVSTRGRGLLILGSLGRWSLLDVFVALVLIVLAHEQGSLFVTDVRPGLYLFLVAILLAMSTGEFMAVLHEKTEHHPKLSTMKARRPSIGAGWRRLAVPALLLGSLASLLVALELPFLKITAWYLTDNSYSILETIATLWTTGEPIFAVIVAVGLVVMPLAKLLVIAGTWSIGRSPHRFRIATLRIRIVSQWSMIDVFGLAIGLFLLEGSGMVPVKGEVGAWALLVAIILNAVLAWTAGSLLTARLK